MREPEFLPEEMPDEPTPVEPSAELLADQTTIASRAQQIEEHPEILETDWIEREPAAADETYAFPESLPEDFPDDATVPHQATTPLDATIVNQRLAAEEAASWDQAFIDETPSPARKI
ncbi:MAG: hypothetical protein U0703_09455 [Anaerolineae bacterium]